MCKERLEYALMSVVTNQTKSLSAIFFHNLALWFTPLCSWICQFSCDCSETTFCRVIYVLNDLIEQSNIYTGSRGILTWIKDSIISSYNESWVQLYTRVTDIFCSVLTIITRGIVHMLVILIPVKLAFVADHLVFRLEGQLWKYKLSVWRVTHTIDNTDGQRDIQLF